MRCRRFSRIACKMVSREQQARIKSSVHHLCTEATVSRFGFAALVPASLFVFCGATHGQETSARGALFVELAGNSLLGATGNAELYLGHQIGTRVGVGRDFFSQTGVFPLQAVMLLGSGHSKLEVAFYSVPVQSPCSGPTRRCRGSP